MLLPPYLFFRYITRSYLSSYVIVIAVITLGLLVSNSFDVITRYRNTELSFLHFIQLISFKIPYLIGEVSFFIGYIATLYFFKRVRRTQELTAMLASGLSIIKIIAVIAVVQFVIGVLFTTVIGHIGPAMLNRIDELEIRIGAGNSASKIQSIIFRKQIIAREELVNGGGRVYNTSFIDVGKNTLGDLIIIQTDDTGGYQGGYFAPKAFLDHKILRIPHAVFRAANGESVEKENVELQTDLKIENFTENIFDPENISFWRMKKKIQTLEKLGMPVLNYQLYHAKVLFRPLSLMVWVIIASLFLVSYSNRASQEKLQYTLLPLLIVGGVYTISESLSRILLQYALDPYYSVLLPQLFLLFLALFVILHLHEE